MLIDSIGFGSLDVLVSCFDTSGNELWSNILGGENLELVNGIEIYQNKLFVFGKTRSESSITYNCFISVFDTIGNLSAQIVFGDSLNNNTKDVVFHNSNLYLLSEKNKQSVISKITISDDSLFLNQTFTVQTQENQYPEKLIFSLNKFYITGSLDTLIGSSKAAFLSCLDTSMNLIFNKKYHSNVDLNISSITISTDQSIYLTGNLIINNFLDALIIKINISGTLSKAKLIFTPLNEKFYDVASYKNYVVSAGYTQSSSGSFDDAIICVFSQDLELFSKSTFAYPNEEYITKLHPQNNVINGSGVFKTIGSNHWGIISIDIDSNFSSCSSVVWNADTSKLTLIESDITSTIDTVKFNNHNPLQTLYFNSNQTPSVICNTIYDSIPDASVLINENLDITIYPNPTKEYLFVESTQVIDEIKILDINGKIITRTTNKKVKTSNLHSGIYICEVSIGYLKYHYKFIKY